MTVSSAFLDARGRYERVADAWTDNSHDDALTHTVCLGDDHDAVEVSAVCTPSPAYEMREVRARAIAGDADPAVASDVGRLAGARMVAGFTRRLAEVCGERPGAALFVDAGIEIARLARQVAKLPAAVTAGYVAGDAAATWNLDTQGWQDLPDSCFAYGPGGRALLAVPGATASATLSLYAPPPGARKVFVRRKVARLVDSGGSLHLFHSMHDDVHGFDLHYEIDTRSGRIARADSVTSRLPYTGICSVPQAKIAALVGEQVDAGFRKRIQGMVGGADGCAQLYDLTADLLKLLTLS